MPDGDLKRVEGALEEHINLTRQEAGCLVFEVTPDPADKNSYRVYEEFVDQAAFEFHQNRVKASHWAKVTGNVERQYEIITE